MSESTVDNSDTAVASMSATRMVINAATNVVQSACSLFVSFWLTRYLIHTLGTAQYGMYPLTKNIIEYFSLITALVVIPAGRNLMMECARNQTDQASRVFNSFFFGIAGILAIILPLLAAVVWWSPVLVKSPPGMAFDIRILFGAVAISFVLTTLSAPFGLATFVKNSLYLKNIGDFVELALFAVAAAVLTGWAGWGLQALALAAVVRAVVRLSWSVGCMARLLPHIPLNLSHFSSKYLHDILSMSGWFLVSTAGSLLFVNTDLILVNRILGPEATGRYGSVLVLFNALCLVSGMVTTVMNPPLMNLYAREGRERFIDTAVKYSRLAGVLIVIPVGLVCGFAAPLLRLWLGESFASLAPALILIAAPLIMEITMVPVATLRILEKKLRVPALIYLPLGIVKICVGAVLTGPAGMGLLGISLGTSLFIGLNAGVATPLFCAHIGGKPPLYFYRTLVPVLFGFGSMIFLSWMARLVLPVQNLIDLGIAATVVSALYGVIAWFVLIDGEQKKMIVTIVNTITGRLKK